MKDYKNIILEKVEDIIKTKKTILITGAAGFIGRYLCEKFSSNYNILGIDLKEVKDFSKGVFLKVDINDYKDVKKLFHNYRIDLVIHSAALKDLTWCEYNRDKSYKTNFLATLNLYNIAKESNSKFIFISSDQVFDGKSGKYKENSPKHPINHYGTLKDICEEQLIKDRSIAICRTAMVFGEIPYNQKEEFNRIKAKDHLIIQGYILDHVKYKLGKNEKIILPQDEFCNPTSTKLLFFQIKSIIENNLSGIFHCCGGERISRYNFGKRIAEIYNLDSSFIDPSSYNDSLRPKDVSLLPKKTEKMIGFTFPNIRDMILEIKEGKV